MLMKKRRWNRGHTLVELICAMAVMAVFAAAAIPLCAGWMFTAKELQLRTQAYSLKDSVQMYALAAGSKGELDGLSLLEDVADKPIASPDNPLHAYLMFEPSNDLMIENITLNQKQCEVEELALVSTRYRVTLSQDGIEIKHR